MGRSAMRYLKRLARLALPVVSLTTVAVAGTPLVTPAIASSAVASNTAAGLPLKGRAASLAAAADCGNEYYAVYPVTGDWDGIGGDGIGLVYEVAQCYLWVLRNGPNAGVSDYTFIFGNPGLGDRVVTGNWDGVGGDGIGIVRPNGNWEWYLRNGPNGGGGQAEIQFAYGSQNDTPVTGNWDGVGGDGPGVVSPGGGWHLRNGPNSGNPDYDFAYRPIGSGAGFRATGNWDGIGGDGIGVVYTVAGGYEWHLRNGPNGGDPEIRFIFA